MTQYIINLFNWDVLNGVDEFQIYNKSQLDSLSETDAAIQRIRKSRLNDPVAEIQRLKDEGFLTSHEIERLDEMFKEKSDFAKALFAEAFAVKKVVGETHFVFLHAQMTTWGIFSDIVKELVKKKYPEMDLHHYKYLRSAKIFENKDLEGISKYEDNPEVHDHDPQTRKDLLSVDGYFYNKQYAESAFDFLIDNVNIHCNLSLIESVVAETIRDFYPTCTNESSLKFAKEATQIIASLEKPQSGNLFVVCIPKNKKDTFYRAHPYGAPCKCHPREENQRILERLQREEIGPGVSCDVMYAPIPQYRLFAPNLEPDRSSSSIPLRSYLFTPYSKEVRKSMKSKIKHLVGEIEHQLNPSSRFPKSAHMIKEIPSLLERLVYNA